VAVHLLNCEKKWFTPIPPAQEGRGGGRGLHRNFRRNFFRGWDSTLRAFSTADGHPLWQYDTTHEIKTLNGIPGKAGSMGAPGPPSLVAYSS